MEYDVKRYKEAAEQGDAIAEFLVGSSYQRGSGVKKDINQAVEWYRKAARKGNKQAQDSLKRLGKKW